MIEQTAENQWVCMPSWMDKPPRGRGSESGYESGFGERRFESADSSRLNSAHWAYAADESVNRWLVDQLSVIRARSSYERKQNGMILGMINTHADDIVGRDGPSLQVISDDDAYNEALEEAWRDWFRSPTTDPNVSGVEVLKGWVRSLWQNGEYLARIITDPMAEGPVSLRLWTRHPRLLASPAMMAGLSDVFMGIRFDQFHRPVQYYILDEAVDGTISPMTTFATVPPDLIIHKFVIEEEGQKRGIPWLNTANQPSADLRDYDDQVQDAARQIADSCGLLYTDHPDAKFWGVPENVNIQRRTIRTVPPGWKPFEYRANQPPVQYPDYRAERQREFGRPAQMPLATIRLDYSRYNYSSARLETQNYYTSVGALQYWLSGTPRSTGTLNRLVDMLAAELRFSDRRLRNKPARVQYQWTWPGRPHVDPTKESNAEGIALGNGTITMMDALAARGTDLETNLRQQRRVYDAYAAAGLPMPEWAQSVAGEVDQETVDAVAEALADGGTSTNE